MTLNYINYIQMATMKEELLVLEIKVNGHYLRQVVFTVRQITIMMRQVAVTCRQGTSVARSLKLLTLPYPFSLINSNYHTIYEP
jgi:hypothetical protein